MKRLMKNGVTSVILRFFLPDSASTTGAGKTALDHTAAGLIISTIASNEATPTVYTSAGSTVETVTTLGTYAAPTATKCRFKKVDDTNHPGIYEVQLADARFAVSNARNLLITILATGVAPVQAEIELVAYDPQDTVRLGLTGIPNAVAGANGGLPLGDASGRVDIGKLLGTAWLTPAVAGTPDVNAKQLGGTAQTGRDVGASVLLSSGTGTGQLDFTSGVVKANLAQILGTALTETAGLLAGGFKKFFNVATPTGTVNSIPDAVAGAASGLALVGSNVGVATSVSGAVGSVTGNVGGNVTGSVGSVVGAVGSVTGNVGGNVTGSVGSVVGDVGGNVVGSVGSAPDSPGTTTLLARLPAAFFAGITSLAQWLGLLAGKQLGNSTARTELRATGAGSGTFDETTDSTEALRDRGDAAWTSGAAAPTAASIADAVWDEATVDHQAAGSFGVVNDEYTAPLDAAGVRAAVGLASANLDTQLDGLPTAAENAAGVLDLAAGVETGLTLRQALRLIVAASAGKLSGAATTTIVIRNPGDSKDRITATVTADGNRTAVVTDLT